VRPAALGCLGLAGLALLAASAPGATASLDFNRVFAAKGEPRNLSYAVAYRSGGVVHRLQIWRQGDRRIVRTTDDVLTSFATRDRDAAGYELTLLDSRRRIRTDIDRTALYRIGSFTDWYDLGHGLRHPKGRYQLTALKAPPTGALQPIAACRWYALTQERSTAAICWSEASRLPLVIAAQGRTVWRVLSVAQSAIPAERFVIHDRGYVRNDANRDIDHD
jgi:hypothetical protein